MGMSQASFSLVSNEAMYHHDLVQRGFVMQSFGSYRLYHHRAHPIDGEWISSLEHTLRHYEGSQIQTRLQSIVLVPDLVNHHGQSIDGRVFEALKVMELRSELPSSRLKENVLHHEIAHLMIKK